MKLAKFKSLDEEIILNENYTWVFESSSGNVKTHDEWEIKVIKIIKQNY